MLAREAVGLMRVLAGETAVRGRAPVSPHAVSPMLLILVLCCRYIFKGVVVHWAPHAVSPMLLILVLCCRYIFKGIVVHWVSADGSW
jgi:hypothetical protein